MNPLRSVVSNERLVLLSITNANKGVRLKQSALSRLIQLDLAL